MGRSDTEPEYGVEARVDFNGNSHYLVDSLWFTIFVFLNNKITGAVKKETGVNPTQLRMMLKLYFSQRAMRVKELSDELLLRENTTVAAVNKLEDSGLVVRKEDPSDLRATLLVLTEKGAETMQSIFGVFERLQDMKPGVFSDENFRALIEISEAFVDIEQAGYYDIDGKLLFFPTCVESLAIMLTRFVIAARRYGVTLTQLHVLCELYYVDEPIRVSAVANRTKTVLNVVTLTANNLQSEGLVMREGDPDDARVKLLSITQKGKETYEKILTVFFRLQPRSKKLAILPPEKLANYVIDHD